MPICQKCHQTWTFKQSVKEVVKIKRKLRCPYCSHDQYQSQHSQWKAILIGTLAPIFAIPFYIFTTNLVSFFVFIGVIIIVLISIPLTLELSNEDEPLW